MVPSIKEMWVKALMGGTYEQGQDELYIPTGNLYCCLGVLCDLYHREQGVALDKLSDDQYIELMEESSKDGFMTLPNDEIANWAGLTVDQLDEVSSLNDMGDSFEVIAAHIHRNY
jgi:hypothetical protein